MSISIAFQEKELIGGLVAEALQDRGIPNSDSDRAQLHFKRALSNENRNATVPDVKITVKMLTLKS